METKMTNIAITDPTPALSGAEYSLLSICPAATTGWALRAADGLVTTGILDLAMPAAQAGAQCDLHLAQWLGTTARHSGPIRAIMVVTLPAFMASPMHPAPASTLQAWADQQAIPCTQLTYAALLSDVSDAPKSEAALRQRGFTPSCLPEILAIIALQQLFAAQEGNG
ncbi:MAG: hypothetical protein JJT99_14890 [Rhodobacteraceae bacterium]|nr:hypothetical protein [Paracoccaceae bacterium]